MIQVFSTANTIQITSPATYFLCDKRNSTICFIKNGFSTNSLLLNYTVVALLMFLSLFTLLKIYLHHLPTDSKMTLQLKMLLCPQVQCLWSHSPYTGLWSGSGDVEFFSTTFKSAGYTTSIYSLVRCRHCQQPQFTNK